ncbi:MAG: hypothetical protein IJJ83_09705 [Muribaculaceae bacterium]|nr:hypothetical protein [Muribaculaceae bacterium]
MKKFTVLLIAVVVALSATAGINVKATHNVRSARMVKSELRSAMPQALKSLKGAPSRVITDQPAGELKSYLRSGDAIYPEGQNIYMGEQVDGRMDIVFADGGKVYLKNILYNIGEAWANSWVEGQLNEDGTEITVAMGQSLYYSYTYQADILLAWGTTEIAYDAIGNPYINFIIDDRMEEVVYTIDGETIYGPEGVAPVENDQNPYWGYEATGLGSYWTDDLSFAGAMEWGTVFTETEPMEPAGPPIIIDQPEGDLYTLMRNSGCIIYSGDIYNGVTDGEMNIVLNEEEGKAYIQNPLWLNDYGYWVEGSYDPETGYISIPTGQYVYYNEDLEYGIQLMWGRTYVTEGFDGYYLNYEVNTDVEEINFVFFEEKLYLLESEGNVMAEFPEWGNATGMVGMYDDTGKINCLELANWNSDGDMLPIAQYINTVPAVPAAPVIEDWYDGGDEEGNSYFIFTMPTVDVDGNLLNPECLSYSIWLDNGNGPELFTFEADTYVNDYLFDDATEIPYWVYAYGYDITAYGCVFYRTNEGDNPLFTQNIGVQAFYEVDGIKNASEIAWLYDRPSSVKDLNANKTIANVRYFNVAGQEMAQPSGMTIKVTTYTDGTTSAVKVVK